MFSGRADCNQYTGVFRQADTAFMVDMIASTFAHCSDSSDLVYGNILDNAIELRETADGLEIIDLEGAILHFVQDE